MSLLTRFLDRVEASPERVAIIDRSGAEIRYDALEKRSSALARRLTRNGIGKGDRVLVAILPGIGLYTALAALWRVGAVAVFPEPASGLDGLRHAAAVTRPTLLLAERWLRGVLSLLPEVRAIPRALSPDDLLEGAGPAPFTPLTAEDPALISFTSGSTGRPKAIVRSHGLLLAQHEALAPLVAPEGEHEVDLVAFPAFVLTCLGHGTTAAMPRWNPSRHDRARFEAISRQVREQGVTRALVPPSVTAIMASDRLPPSLRRILTGGGPVYPDVAKRLLDRSPGTGITVVYGSTEAEPISHLALETVGREIWAEASSGGGLPVGRPVPEATVRILDREIIVAGAHVNPGYLDPSQDTENKIHANGLVWHRTGDAGRIDAAGCLWLLGRVSAVVGEHLPFAVETAARLWPGVEEAALAAVGSEPILFVAGNEHHRREWEERAGTLAGVRLVAVRSIPMDRRHRSKPDLRRLVKGLPR